MKTSRREALIGMVASLPLFARAADYPAASIRMVVGFSPGGGTDGAARIVAEKLDSELGQSVVVDNRVGAGGTIGAQSVVRALPDGYTLFFGSSAELLIHLITRKKAAYDLLKDFVPIADVGVVTLVLIVPAQSPIHSVPALVAAGLAQPGKLNYSSFGIGSTNHMLGEMFGLATGVKATHVPYPGSSQAITALLSGEVNFAFETAAIALPQIRAGKLRALATPSPRRLRELPDVPTLQEAGYRDLVAEGWLGIFAPAATPTAVVQKLRTATAHVLQQPDVDARLVERGILTARSTPDEYRDKLAGEAQKWRRVARDTGISLD